MTTSPNTPPSGAQGPQDAPQPRPPMRHVGCAVVLALLALALGGLLTAIPIAARIIVLNKMPLSPDERRQMQRFLNEPVEIPQKLLEASPYPPQVTAELQRLMELWNKHLPKAEEAYRFTEFEKPGGFRSLSQDAWDTVTAILKAGEPLTSQISVLARVPGYDLEVFFPPQGLSLTEGNDSWAMRNCASLLKMKAYERAYAGEWTEALSNTLTMLELSRHSALMPVYSHSNAVELQEWALQYTAKLALECTSTQALSSTLSRLNELKPIFNAESFEGTDLMNVVCNLRSFRREGYPLQISKPKTLAQYTIELQEKTGPEFRRWMLANMDIKDPRRSYLERTVSYDVQRNLNRMERLLERWATCMVPEVVYMQLSGSGQFDSEVQRLHQVRRAQYDLTRLLLAGRLAQAEGNQTSSSLEVLVPRYLPELPLDPFSKNKPYLWDANQGLFYSVGPDGVDDKAKTFYGGSGTGSGDIEIPSSPSISSRWGRL